jgi:hypothetical protein
VQAGRQAAMDSVDCSPALLPRPPAAFILPAPPHLSFALPVPLEGQEA